MTAVCFRSRPQPTSTAAAHYPNHCCCLTHESLIIHHRSSTISTPFFLTRSMAIIIILIDWIAGPTDGMAWVRALCMLIHVVDILFGKMVYERRSFRCVLLRPPPCLPAAAAALVCVLACLLPAVWSAVLSCWWPRLTCAVICRLQERGPRLTSTKIKSGLNTEFEKRCFSRVLAMRCLVPRSVCVNLNVTLCGTVRACNTTLIFQGF